MKVAPLKTTGQKCLICVLETPAREAVNAAIWDGSSERVRGYRAAGVRAFTHMTGGSIDPKSITRHADDTEATWHDTNPADPASDIDVPVFDSSYEAIVQRAANLGKLAIEKLPKKVAADELEDRELVSVAKMGVGARTQQESNRVASNRPQIQVAAILGVVAGGMGNLPADEVIDVTPEAELIDVVRQERKALQALAKVQANPEDDGLGALFDG